MARSFLTPLIGIVLLLNILDTQATAVEEPISGSTDDSNDDQENQANTGDGKDDQDIQANTDDDNDDQENQANTGDGNDDQENQANTGDGNDDQENQANTGDGNDDQENQANTGDGNDDQENQANTGDGKDDQGIQINTDDGNEEQGIQANTGDGNDDQGIQVNTDDGNDDQGIQANTADGNDGQDNKDSATESNQGNADAVDEENGGIEVDKDDSLPPRMKGEYVVGVNGAVEEHVGAQREGTGPEESLKEQELQEEEELEEKLQVIKDIKKDNPNAGNIDQADLSELTTEEIKEILKEGPSRRKRYVPADPRTRWTGGIVPFVYADDVSDWQRHEINISTTILERETCLRFVPWVNGVTKQEYGLDHEGHLNFVKSSGCWSYVGNLRWEKGQGISGCNRYASIHELGHALGIGHEHQNPHRDGMIRVNWENLWRGRWSLFGTKEESDIITYKYYDITSAIHYGPASFAKTGMASMTSLIPEMHYAENLYYQFFETSESHNCKGLKCPDFKLECENDGYVSYVEDECTCTCPYGLNRTDGCTTTITHAPPRAWAAGSYALLAPEDGCPPNSIFSEGELTHWSNGGSTKSDEFHMKGDYSPASTNIHFCVVENGGTGKWTAGTYCIFRVGGQCLEGFRDGSVKFDDVTDSTKVNSNSGSLPDGVFDTDTLFNVCCRDDNFEEVEMELPNKDPIVLLKKGKYCQAIKGMYFTEEFYSFDNLAGSTIYGGTGFFPGENEAGTKKFKISLCYYRPLDMDCGEVIVVDRDNTSVSITSPNYPNPYNPTTECNWLIKSPVNTTILLNINDFEVEVINGECVSHLAIRHNLLGQPGIKYCGNKLDESIRSLQNTMALTFRTGANNGNKKGFNLTVSVILPEDHCYDLSDLGTTYRGKVNYTRDMKACLPWTEVTQCEYYAQNEKYFNDGLDENYCRNPQGHGIRPWCYTGYSKTQRCLRNYCDVCRIEKLYDTKENCQELKASADFCENGPEAFSGCAKTCEGSYPPLPTIQKASAVVCEAPVIPTDADLVSAGQAPFKLGDTVTVKCKTSGDNITAACHTDGSWNLGNYICGACPIGWTPHSGACFKFFDEKLTQQSATDRCAEFGGILAPTKSLEELTYVISLRTFMKSIWLAASDAEEEGKWMWSDDTEVTWFDWDEKEPSNKGNEDCAIIEKENKKSKWSDTYCHSHHRFVCKKQVEESTICVDRQDDCQYIFEASPRSCKDYPEFARYECPHTCGLCPGTATTCVVSQLTPNTKVLTEGVQEAAKTGDVVSYACADQTLRARGDRDRGCSVTGELTGDPLVCLPLEYFETPVNDVELVKRTYVGWKKYSYTGQMKEFDITRSGQITQWRLHSVTPGRVMLQVWRHVSGNRYKFIGQNILLIRDGAQAFDIPANERIEVQPGDSLGLFFANPKPGVTFDPCPGNEGNVFVTWFRGGKSFVPGTEFPLSSKSQGCKRFSINAMIQAKETPNNMVSLVNRKKIGEPNYAYTGPMTDLLLHKDGDITEWRFYSTGAAAVVLQVWRHKTMNSYEFVGQNILNGVEGYQAVKIDQGSRIKVKKGDFIGVYYLGNDGIPFSECDDNGALVAQSDTSYPDPNSFTKGTSYDFVDASCRRFSVTAFIGDSTN